MILRRRELLACMLIVASALPAGCSQPAATPAQPKLDPRLPAPGRPDRVAGEYLIQIRAGVSETVLLRALRKYEPRIRSRHGQDRVLVFLKRDPGLAALRSLVQRDPALLDVEPNRLYYTR